MLIHYLGKYKLRVILYIIMMITSTFSYAALVLNVGDIFDAITAGDMDTVLRLFTILFFGFLAIRVLDYYADALSVTTTNWIRENFKEDIFLYKLEKGSIVNEKKDRGEYVAEFTNDVTMFEKKGISASKELISGVVSIISADITITLISPYMLIMVMTGTILCIIVPVFTSRKTISMTNDFLSSFDRYIQRLDDYFCGFSMMKNYAVEQNFEKKFCSENMTVENKKLSAECRMLFVNSLIGVIAWFTQTGILVIGLFGAYKGIITIGAVISAYILAANVNSPLRGIVIHFNEIISIKGIEEKFQMAMKEYKKQTDITDDLKLNNSDVEFKGVSLSIDGDIILDNVNCLFGSEKKYLIVGENGSGKSTLMKILKNVYSEWTGTVRLGDNDLRSIPYRIINDTVSYSNENVSLLCDTVANNITLFKEISEQQLKKAVELSRISLPLDKVIGDRGCRISSGERRKLEIARNLVNKPGIMIFDEVISTLDIETAYEIEKLILNLPSCTIIMISNAFSGLLLDSYDKIFLMDKGRIIASGTHKYLLDSSPEYRKIYEIRCGSIL